MTVKFEKIEAGQYRIVQNTKMIGFVRKQSASKWVMYKCTNLSVLGNPVLVKKTLKEIKAESENIFNESNLNEMDEHSSELDDLLNQIKSGPDKFDLMKEMLKNETKIEINQYDFEGNQIPFSEFLNEDAVMVL